MKVYKFRGPTQIERVFDILLNKQIYCSNWSSLNDPVEGVFAYSSGRKGSDVELAVRQIEDAKSKYRVCALSKTFDNHLLWAHYAQGFSGLAIEFDIDENEEELVEVDYRGVFAFISDVVSEEPHVLAKKILSSKYDVWAYEQEIRILTTEPYYKLKKPVQKVILGHRMDSSLSNAIKIICERLEIPIARTGIGDEGIDLDRVSKFQYII